LLLVFFAIVDFFIFIYKIYTWKKKNTGTEDEVKKQLKILLKADAVLLLGHMGLVIMGMGGLFVLLEIGTIIFIRLALKQEKPDV